MLALILRRPGLLAFGSLALLIGAIALATAVWGDHLPAEARSGFVVILIACIAGLVIFGALFLYKSYRATLEREVTALGLAGYFFGSLLIGTLFWAVMITFAMTFYIHSHEPIAAAAVTREPVFAYYILEQLLSGVFLDVLEVYKIKFTDVDYGADEYVFATLTLGMRLTGSFIVASLFVRALTMARSRP